jgi:hypothetical protein
MMWLSAAKTAGIDVANNIEVQSLPELQEFIRIGIVRSFSPERWPAETN